MPNEFETIVLDVDKKIEVTVVDVLKILGAVKAKSPAGLAALTALAGAVEKALEDSAADTNVATLVLTLPTTVSDFKTVWTDGKALLTTLGIK